MNFPEYGIVPARRWFTDERCVGPQAKTLRPQLQRDLVEICESGHSTVLLGGGIGWGKSVMADALIMRRLYELSEYDDPQAVLGLAPKEKIHFLYVLTTAEHRRQRLTSLATKIRESPRLLALDPHVTRSEIRFPKGLTITATGPEAGALGLNTYCVVVDDVYSADAAKVDMLVETLLRRIQARFHARGCGTMIIAGSARPDGIVERKANDLKGSPTLFWRNYTTWEVAPERFAKSNFRVGVADDLKKVWIMAAKEPTPPAAHSIDVPVDFLRDFQRDPYEALRDIAGVPVATP